MKAKLVRNLELIISISDDNIVGCEIRHTGVGILGKEYTTLTWDKLSKYEKIKIINSLGDFQQLFYKAYTTNEEKIQKKMEE